jgi:hypothetical protein
LRGVVAERRDVIKERHLGILRGFVWMDIRVSSKRVGMVSKVMLLIRVIQL